MKIFRFFSFRFSSSIRMRWFQWKIEIIRKIIGPSIENSSRSSFSFVILVKISRWPKNFFSFIAHRSFGFITTSWVVFSRNDSTFSFFVSSDFLHLFSRIVQLRFVSRFFPVECLRWHTFRNSRVTHSHHWNLFTHLCLGNHCRRNSSSLRRIFQFETFFFFLFRFVFSIIFYVHPMNI